MTDAECDAISSSRAIAGICPTTEGNLGDGLFPLKRFLDAGGVFGVGSDSHVSQCPVEELRLLEYGQRLIHQRRNIAGGGRYASVGRTLWEGAVNGGAQASGRPVAGLKPGNRADLIVLDEDHVNITGRRGDMILDSFIFAGNDCLVRDVMVGGNWVIREGSHARQAEVAASFGNVVNSLL